MLDKEKGAKCKDGPNIKLGRNKIQKQ